MYTRKSTNRLNYGPQSWSQDGFWSVLQWHSCSFYGRSCKKEFFQIKTFFSSSDRDEGHAKVWGRGQPSTQEYSRRRIAKYPDWDRQLLLHFSLPILLLCQLMSPRIELKKARFGAIMMASSETMGNWLEAIKTDKMHHDQIWHSLHILCSWPFFNGLYDTCTAPKYSVDKYTTFLQG